MEKEFVPYELALRLKELGFKGRTLTYYENGKPKLHNAIEGWDFNSSFLTCISRPTFSQAFRFFRVKYSICVEIHETTDWEEDNESWSFVIFKYRLGDNDGMISSTIDYDTYEEAELECLKKLIEIVK
jgi:hypothetical protein